MITKVDSRQSIGNVGVAQLDITPPIGIYHRMWGAAKHDQATGVHRPLMLTVLWIAHADEPSEKFVLITMDHCILDGAEIKAIRKLVSTSCNIEEKNIVVSLSHTHGSGWMSRSRSNLPGGDLIGPYLDGLIQKCASASINAINNSQSAFIAFGSTRCNLAAHRDYYDETSKQFVCGFNPEGLADDTVLVARIENVDGKCLATLVNYACHPTTLAWENTKISPDYIGSMREIIEKETLAPCLFLQGSSGDLGPKDGFVGDHKVADRNGRQLGFAVLSGLESLAPTSTCFTYSGPVVSGATLGIWNHQPLQKEELYSKKRWGFKEVTIQLPYRSDLPTLEETKAQLLHWQHEETKALSSGDQASARDFRALVEQMTRQITRLSSLPGTKTYEYTFQLLIWGDSLWVFLPGELYQMFQINLRNRFPSHAVIIATLSNEWQPGYLPEASSYGYGIYQEKIATVAPGCLEVLLETVTRELKHMMSSFN